MEAVTGAASIKEESFNMWDLKHLEDSNTHLSRAEFFKNPSRFNNVAKVKTGYKNFILFFFFVTPPGVIFVGATVSWLMADSGRLQTDRDRGVRESKDQVSLSSLSHIMSGGQ